jgi:hypothetical protein
VCCFDSADERIDLESYQKLLSRRIFGWFPEKGGHVANHFDVEKEDCCYHYLGLDAEPPAASEQVSTCLFRCRQPSSCSC